MEKQRILFVNCMMESGGVERSLCDVLNHMDYDRYDVFLYLDSCSGALLDQLPHCVTVIQPNMDGLEGSFGHAVKSQFQAHNYSKIVLRVIRKLSGIFGCDALYLNRLLYQKYGTFDAVIAYREGFITQFAYRAFRYRRFLSWWHYGKVEPEKDVDLAYARLKKIDHLVGVSQGVCRAMKRSYPELSAGVCLIPNMLDISAVLSRAEALEPYRKQGEFHLVSVGRLSPEKHFENIIPVSAYLKENGIKVCWHLVGDGPEYQKLHSAIAEAGLSREIVLEGNQPNPYPYMKNADLFVHPSYVESQGIVVMEAMALGIPCVVTKSLGPCEFLEDGHNGILTEQSPESLSEKVLEILNDPQLYHRIKENTACPEAFLPENVMKKIEALLE